MRFYFEDKGAADRLAAEVRTWLGTPFRHACGVKGLGADCIHFVARALAAVCPEYRGRLVMPSYPRDWHNHRSEELLAAGLEGQIAGVWTGAEDLMAGDIVLHRFGKAASHSGIVSGGCLWHAVSRIGVTFSPLNDGAWSRRRERAYRLVRV